MPARDWFDYLSLAGQLLTGLGTITVTIAAAVLARRPLGPALRVSTKTVRREMPIATLRYLQIRIREEVQIHLYCGSHQPAEVAEIGWSLRFIPDTYVRVTAYECGQGVLFPKTLAYNESCTWEVKFQDLERAIYSLPALRKMAEVLDSALATSLLQLEIRCATGHVFRVPVSPPEPLGLVAAAKLRAKFGMDAMTAPGVDKQDRR